MNVVSSPYHAQPRIVAALERLLEAAKSGHISGIFILHEDEYGNLTRENDGWSDTALLFALEIVKLRMLSQYRINSATPTAP